MNDRQPRVPTQRLEELPNIGRSIAADLRTAGIETPAELAAARPLEVYQRLEPVMGHRHDPCVLHTLLAVDHFFKTSETVPWWKFTTEGQALLRENR